MPLMTKSELEVFFKKLKEAYPNPTCELNFENHFTLLTAIILSAQSTDKGVNKVTQTLFKVANTPQKMASLSLEEIISHVKSLNYFNNKSKAILSLAQILTQKYNGIVPNDFDTLLTLPGVGKKTASVFLNIAYKMPLMGVDTHVFRLCHRLGICAGKTPLIVQEKLKKIVPDEYKSDFSLALVLHGRYICTAKKPKCQECPLISVCYADINPKKEKE